MYFLKKEKDIQSIISVTLHTSLFYLEDWTQPDFII